MIVVADTSPICYLVLIEEIHLLHKLFESICIPEAVLDELANSAAPMKVRNWIHQPPDWLMVMSAPKLQDIHLNGLHLGERESLALALQRQASLVILDDKKARAAAKKLQLRITGLVGVLEQAALAGMVEFHIALSRLAKTNFRLAPSLVRAVLERHYGRFGKDTFSF